MLKTVTTKYSLRTKYYFKDLNGDPFLLTPGQDDIFRVIYEPDILRATVKATTQYGKSEVASMALLMACVERKEKVIIVAPSLDQAGIIMGKIIDHIFDHNYLIGMIEYSGSLDRLRNERSKTRITFRNGSEIRILTADVRTLKKQGKGLMGFGATIILVDESALIPEELWSKILRMVGGVAKGKLVKLGNPFLDPLTNQPNHFAKSFKSKRYEKISIDWRQALDEGRLTQDFLDEAKEDMPEVDWLVFYECKFPESGVDNALIPLAWINNAVNQDLEVSDDAHKQSGLDVARFGGDSTIYVHRKGSKTLRMEEAEMMDTMEVVGWVRPFIDEDEPEETAIDEIGIGSGVVDRLEELEYSIVGINVGSSPIAQGEMSEDEAKEKFFNLRAQVHWYLRSLFKPDQKTGKSQISIPNDPELKGDLASITYGYSSERKIKIDSKDEIKKRIGRSPDKGDALSLAYFDLTGLEPQIIIY